MKKEASLPVRLDADEKRRLKAAAARMGLTASSMIRLLVHSFVEEYDRAGGRLTLPPRWQEEAVAGSADKPLQAAETRARYATRAPQHAANK